MTLSLVAKSQFTSSPQVKLTATSTTAAPSPIPNNSRITVFRVHADGSEHVVLTDAAPRFIGGSWVWLDPHCPFNQAVTYRVEANGFSATSAAVWLLSKRTWLVHPTRADLAVMVEMVTEVATRSTPSRSAKFVPLGGKPVFLTNGARDSVSGSMTILSTNTDPLRELFADDSVILIKTPGTAGWDIKWLWVQPGSIDYGNLMPGVRHLERIVTIPFEESADPTVALEPVWTAGVAAAYWASQGVNAGQMATKYATAGDLTTDTRL